MKPLMAISLDSGTKHIVSYFLPSDGRCDLTLMIGERPTIDDMQSSESVERLRVSVDAEKIARFLEQPHQSLERRSIRGLFD